MGKRTLVYWIIAAIIVVAVIVGVVLNRSNNTATNNPSAADNTSSSNNQPTTAKNNTPQTVTTDKVGIADMAFTPAAIKVKVGTTVTWTNNDSIAHTVTADSGDGPDSGNLDPGKTYSFTYKTAGTFSYHCQIHPDMTGTVQVTQ